MVKNSSVCKCCEFWMGSAIPQSHHLKTNQNDGHLLVFSTWNRPSKSLDFRSQLYFLISDIHLVLNESVFVRENFSRDLNNGQVRHLSCLIAKWSSDNADKIVHNLHGTQHLMKGLALVYKWFHLSNTIIQIPTVYQPTPYFLIFIPASICS